MSRRRKTIKPAKKRWYTCNGGPFAGRKIMLTSDFGGTRATMTFKVGNKRGHYEHTNHFSITWMDFL